MRDQIPDLGRFAEPSLYILVSLSGGPKHGYAIMTDVEAISGSPLGPGTLYAALTRLERRGLIEALEPEERRRPYRLTSSGRPRCGPSWSTCRASPGPPSSGSGRPARDDARWTAPDADGDRMSRYPRPIVEALPGPALRARRAEAGTGLSRRQLLRRGVAAGVTVWLVELVGGTLAFAWSAIGSVAPRVRVGTLAELVAANPGLPIRDGFPAYVQAARAFVDPGRPGRGSWQPGVDRPATAPR